MNQKAIDKLFGQIWRGSVTSRNLPQEYYGHVSGVLLKKVSKGFGSKKGLKEVYQELEDNTQMFAAAKTYQITKELEAAKRKSGSLKNFKKSAQEIYDKYETWGEAEANTAEAQAYQAKAWRSIEEDAAQFPKLRYSAIIDGVTSEICKPLDGIVLPVNHPLWKKYSPLNHYNCRCILTQETADVRSTIAGKINNLIEVLDNSVDGVFKHNPGQTNMIFSQEHPYFDVPKKDKAFARRNFDLPFKKDS